MLLRFSPDGARRRTEEVIGTLAGDDTVLLILKTPEDVPVMIKKLQGLLKN